LELLAFNTHNLWGHVTLATPHVRPTFRSHNVPLAFTTRIAVFDCEWNEVRRFVYFCCILWLNDTHCSKCLKKLIGSCLLGTRRYNF